MAIEESKDLSSLALDELIRNLKVHKVVMEKDSEIYKGKKERIKSIALKAKKESSDDETLTSRSDDEESAMAVRNFKNSLEERYIKEMLKKFGLEDSKPTKTPMSTEIKLIKDDEADSVDNSKYQENLKTTYLEAVKRIFRYIRGTSHLRLWYPKGTGIEIVVYADSDHAGDYVDRKSTSGVCTFMGCCLTSRFAKQQMALATPRLKPNTYPPERRVNKHYE
nr:uncharacterized mitochondrial protein AtMg00810-like [Tanacetum cinerariifolium]